MEELDTWILGRENPCFWGLWGKERKGRDSVCARLASLAGVHPVPRQPSTETTENAAERVSIAVVRPREDFQLDPARGREAIEKMVVMWPRMNKRGQIVLVIQHCIEGVLTTSKDGSIQLDTGFRLVVEEKGRGGSREVKR